MGVERICSIPGDDILFKRKVRGRNDGFDGIVKSYKDLDDRCAMLGRRTTEFYDLTKMLPGEPADHTECSGPTRRTMSNMILGTLTAS